MEVDDAIVGSLQKKRKFSPVVWDGEETRPYVVSREANLDDGEELEAGELVEEDFSRAPNVLTSRWANDDDLEVCGKGKGKAFVEGKVVKERSSSPESGVTTQKEDSDCTVRRLWGSNNGDEDGCSVQDFEIDENMEVDLCDDDRDCVSKGVDNEGAKVGVVGGGKRSMLKSCRSVRDEYDNVGKISEGAYGVVYKARGKKSKELVALKKMKLGKKEEGFPVHFLREINILLSLNHPSVLNVREVVVDESRFGLGDVYLVMDYMEHDLQALMEARKPRFSQSEVKCLMLQLLEGVKYLHDNWVIHRDLKTSNILYNNQGELKICDFGMSRQYGSSPLKPYTALVVTLWYRAPELLLGAEKYSTAVDMWSVGCIMAELLTSKPFFEGKSELDQLDKIFRKLGTPNEKIWPGYSELPGVKVNFVHQPYNLLRKEFPRASFTSSPTLSDLGLDLLSRLLTYDPEKRISAEEALKHHWFEEVPLPTSKEFMPTFPAAPRRS